MVAAYKSASTPYGDVTYADPGYRDGKARYPLDSKAHCESAWRFINEADNAAEYTPEQLKTIKSRILAAGKKYGIDFAEKEPDEPDMDGQRSDALAAVLEERFRFKHGWIPIGGSSKTPAHADAVARLHTATSMEQARTIVSGMRDEHLTAALRERNLKTSGTRSEMRERLIESVGPHLAAADSIGKARTMDEARAAAAKLSDQHLTLALRQRNLKTSGTRAEMRQRLIDDIASHLSKGQRRSIDDDEDPRSDRLAVCTRSYDFEIRSVSRDGRRLVGTVAVFNTRTRIPDRGGDFDEIVLPGFADRSLRENGYPVMQFDHGKDPRVGTVPIGKYDVFEKRSNGYEVEGDLFDNAVVEPVRQAIQGGAIRGMSFRFKVSKGGDKWDRRSGGIDLRQVADADVPEAGPVVFPAYRDTRVAVRSVLNLFDVEEQERLLRELRAEAGLDEDFTGRRDTRGARGGETDEQPWEGEASPNPLDRIGAERELLLARPMPSSLLRRYKQ